MRLLDLFGVMIFGRLPAGARLDKYQEKKQEQQRTDRRQVFGLGLAVVARSSQELQQSKQMDLSHHADKQTAECKWNRR